MKQKLLTLIFSTFISTFVFAQTAGQKDDFEDTTVQGWTEGGGPNLPTNEVGGIDGRYLNNISSGVGTAGSRLAMFNSTQWIGDYITAGIKSISMQVRNNSAVTVNLRVGFGDGLSSISAYWLSTTSVDLAAGSGWTTIVFPITETYMSRSVEMGSETATYASVLGACAVMRILSAATVTHKGDKIAGDLDVDNITANDTFLNTKEQRVKSTFSINPNPGSNKLNLKLSRLDDNTTIEVFDVLGKKVYAEKLNSASKSINVFKWNSGVYLVRITSDNGTQTKRFVKQ